MATCVEGHISAATDYCDVCGTPMSAQPVSTPAAEQTAVVPVPTAAKECPACGAPVVGRFCEDCGHDSALPAPPSGPSASTAQWTAVIDADRAYYDRVQAREGPDADAVAFPSYFPQRRIALQGEEFLIGKHSRSQGVTPAIDLSVPPADAGVSRVHAVVRIVGDGLELTDVGSTNGTSLNGSDDLLPPDVATPLHSGDRVHVGAWTTITFVLS